MCPQSFEPCLSITTTCKGSFCLNNIKCLRLTKGCSLWLLCVGGFVRDQIDGLQRHAFLNICTKQAQKLNSISSWILGCFLRVKLRYDFSHLSDPGCLLCPHQYSNSPSHDVYLSPCFIQSLSRCFPNTSCNIRKANMLGQQPTHEAPQKYKLPFSPHHSVSRVVPVLHWLLLSQSQWFRKWWLCQTWFGPFLL